VKTRRGQDCERETKARTTRVRTTGTKQELDEGKDDEDNWETQGKRRETGGELRKEDLALGAIEYSLYISSREGTLGNSEGTKY